MSDTGKAANLLDEILRSGQKGPPPVHLWNPPFCGDLDMRIARDGSWYYLGTPISRPAMVRLFSSVIRRDGDDYFLVTPVEKVGITVEDAPFVALSLQVEGAGEAQQLRFITNVDEEVVAGSDHPLRVEVDPVSGEPSPYLKVRANLEALVHRNVFYQLVDLAVPAEHDGEEWLGVWSGGQFFPIGRAE
jgi:hypothetical protein